VDGRRHIAGDPDKDAYNRRLYPPVHIRTKARAADLVGVEELHVVKLRNEPLHFGQDSAFARLSAKPGVRWLIDSRNLQANATHEVRVGIVGSGGRAALDQHIAELTRDGTWVLAQSEFGEGLSPTPYLVVLRAGDESAHSIGPGWASSSDAATVSDGQPISFYLPPELRGRFASPQGKRVLWPPVPCKNSAKVTYKLSPFAEPFVSVPNTDMLLAVTGHKPGNIAVFDLIVNPRDILITDGRHVFHRVPGHPTGPSIAWRMRFGPEGNAQATYEIAGRTYYIQCYGIGGMSKGTYEVVEYRFEVQW
jgi:hypothetical protein